MYMMAGYQRRLMGTFIKSTLSPPEAEELKFSSFLRSDKTYTIPKPTETTIVAPKF